MPQHKTDWLVLKESFGLIARMRFLALIYTNLRRHKLRALLGVAGISFGVAAMLTILAIVHGAIGMFERILAVDSQYLVFEKNVSDLFLAVSPKLSWWLCEKCHRLFQLNRSFLASFRPQGIRLLPALG